MSAKASSVLLPHQLTLLRHPASHGCHFCRERSLDPIRQTSTDAPRCHFRFANRHGLTERVFYSSDPAGSASSCRRREPVAVAPMATKPRGIPRRRADSAALRKPSSRATLARVRQEDRRGRRCRSPCRVSHHGGPVRVHWLRCCSARCRGSARGHPGTWLGGRGLLRCGTQPPPGAEHCHRPGRCPDAPDSRAASCDAPPVGRGAISIPALLSRGARRLRPSRHVPGFTRVQFTERLFGHGIGTAGDRRGDAACRLDPCAAGQDIGHVPPSARPGVPVSTGCVEQRAIP